MIECEWRHLEQRCVERGYTLDEVRPCVVSEHGTRIKVDEAHPAYPRQKKPGLGGPGTELSNILKRFGIEPTPTCQCRAKAREMDAWGPDECSKPERIEEVLGVMREEARARGLPFLDAAGRMLIRRAIANARRAAS